MNWTRALALVLTLAWAMPANAETPQQGAASILELIKTRNYHDLFQQRYTEWFKVEAQGVAPAAAVAKLSSKWEKQRPVLLELFEGLAVAEFDISPNERPNQAETDEIASAVTQIQDKSITYHLYKMKNGRWGFHM